MWREGVRERGREREREKERARERDGRWGEREIDHRCGERGWEREGERESEGKRGREREREKNSPASVKRYRPKAGQHKGVEPWAQAPALAELTESGVGPAAHPPRAPRGPAACWPSAPGLQVPPCYSAVSPSASLRIKPFLKTRRSALHVLNIRLASESEQRGGPSLRARGPNKGKGPSSSLWFALTCLTARNCAPADGSGTERCFRRRAWTLRSHGGLRGSYPMRGPGTVNAVRNSSLS